MRKLAATFGLLLLAACGSGADDATLARAPTSPTGSSTSIAPPPPAPNPQDPAMVPISAVSGDCPRGGSAADFRTPNPDNFNPCDPARSGYSLSFADEFNTIDTIDLNYSTPNASRKNWYFKSFWNPDTPAARVRVENGVLSLDYMPGVYGLQTAAPDGLGGWVGRAFGGGGFFEARIRFNPDVFGPGSEGIRIGGASWPAFWSMAVEHGAFWTGADQWPGQPKGYSRFIENDFFEYLAWGYGASKSKSSYGAVLHDWYGVWNQTCGNGYCDALDYGRDSVFITLPYEVNWNEFNTISQLWMPAKDGKPGYALNFFNGRPVSINYWWDEGNDRAPPNARNRFSVMDRQRLFLVLGTGPGAPIQVDYVRVWQNPLTRRNQTN